MNGKRLWPTVVVAAVTCVLGGLLVWACRCQPVDLATQGVTNLGSLTLGQDLVVGRHATVGGNVKVGAFLQYTSGTTLTVVNTQPITPTATYQQIAAAVNVYTDNLVRAGAPTGQLWVLQNIGTPTITITDENTCNLASTYAMGISDTLALIFDGTSWVELYRSNN